MALKVQQQSPEVKAMSQNWPVVDALLGGTPAMRAAARQYLPQFVKEADEAYTRRLATATLYPAMRRTISVMAGKPFAKELQLSDDTPAEIVKWAENIDLEGQSLHNFSAKLFEATLGYGLEGVLVDYPVVEAVQEGAVLSKADEQKQGLRPYFSWINHKRILGWQTKLVNGHTKFTMLRITDERRVTDGAYGEVCIPQVRVLFPGAWEIWEPVKAGDTENYVLYKKGTTPNMEDIPFVPFYGTRTGHMGGQSPLLDLAHLNIKHWQSQSDQDTILHVARVPILAMIGADDQSQLTVGGSSAVKLPLGAELRFVEHSGEAIGAGQTSLDRLEQQMVHSGADLLLIKPGQRTATESNQDAEGSKCDLQRMAESFEQSLDDCLRLMAQWVKLPKGGKVTLFKDFGAVSLTDASAQTIVTMAQSGFLTLETVLAEQQRRGVLSPDLDPKEEAAKAKANPAVPPATDGAGSAAVPAKKPELALQPTKAQARTITITRNAGNLTATEH